MPDALPRSLSLFDCSLNRTIVTLPLLTYKFRLHLGPTYSRVINQDFHGSAFYYVRKSNFRGSNSFYVFYSGDTENDIALLLLKHPFRFNKVVSPIALPPKNYKAKGWGEIAGWGAVNNDESKSSDVLKWARLEVSKMSGRLTKILHFHCFC